MSVNRPKSAAITGAAESNRLLWRAYADNSARHIMALSRHMQLNLMNSLTEHAGYDGLRLNYEPFIAALARQQVESGSGGIRPSQLAAQQGISKQVCNQILNQLERYQYIERVPDPDDGRARLIHLTAKGSQLAVDGQAALARVEALYIERAEHFVGPSRAGAQLNRFAQTLAVLAKGLSLLPASLDLSRLSTAQLLGSVLPPLENYVSQRLMHLTMQQGHPDIAMAHGSVLTLIGTSGGRIQHMAQTHNVSKQAISAIATELEKLGYIARQSASAVDGVRSSLLVFTPRGWQLIADSIDSVTQLEAEWQTLIAGGKSGIGKNSIGKNSIGKNSVDKKSIDKKSADKNRVGKDRAEKVFGEFREFLADLYHALRLEEEVFDRPLMQILAGTASESDSGSVAVDQPDLGLLARQLKTHLGASNARRLARLLAEC